jgi:hypothetical protein
MDGGQLTAIIIVAIVMLPSNDRASVRGPPHRVVVDDGQAKAENQR